MMGWHRLPFPKRLIDLSQYIPLRIVTTLLQSCPLEMAVSLGRNLGRLICFLDRKHRGVISGNLKNAYGDKLNHERTRTLARRVYEHFSIMLVHGLFATRLINRNTVSRYVHLENPADLDTLLKQGRGVILVGAHFGNWELAIYAMSLMGYPVNYIVFKMFNPLVNDALINFRMKSGMKVIYTIGAIEAGIKALMRNEIVVVLADQTGRQGGIPADFFGGQASTLWGPANLSLKSGAPIVTFHAYMVRDKFRYTLKFGQPIRSRASNDKGIDIQRITQEYTSRIEEFIRQHPEQWMWFHRRWKTYAYRNKLGITPESLLE